MSEEIKKQQLAALDTLGRQVADLDTELDKLAKLTNDFDVEAQVYVIKSFANRMARTAERIHNEMHTENSKDHPHLCDQQSTKGVFEYIFGKGFKI